MAIFPNLYSKPILTGIVDAADQGWSAVCEGGLAPSSGTDCSSGHGPHTAPLCPGNGAGANSNRLYNNTGNRPANTRLINPGDVGSGI